MEGYPGDSREQFPGTYRCRRTRPEQDRETSTNPAPEVSPSSKDTGKDETPAAGSTNENGAVYDPVFGWVVPGQVNQTTVDSGGDPNKMVGNMGN